MRAVAVAAGSGYWEVEMKVAAFADDARHADRCAVRGDDGLGDRKAKANPTRVAGIQLPEAVEDPR